MIKLKNILAEGFAWERKEGKGLPTMAEVQAEYASKMAENHQSNFSEYSDDALMDMKVNLSRYQGHKDELEQINRELDTRRQNGQPANEAVSQAEYAAKQLKENTGNIFDEIADQLGISSESFDDAIDSSRAELDIIENIYMSDSYTSTEALNMIADMLDIDINEAVTGEDGRTETISPARATAELKQKLAGIRSDGMGDYTPTIYGVNDSGKKVKLTKLSDIAKFKTFGITEKEPRWQDNDGDGNWYEPGVDVKKNVNESFVGRLKKNLIGGAVRK